MILALRAHFAIPIDLLAVDDFPAVIALEPHPLATFRARWRNRFCGLVFLEPRHRCRPTAVVCYSTNRLCKSAKNTIGLCPTHHPAHRQRSDRTASVPNLRGDQPHQHPHPDDHTGEARKTLDPIE